MSDTCCLGITGNVDNDTANIVDIADVMTLVSYLTTAEPIPACPSESDVTVDSAIDVLDILTIVDHLVSGLPLPECPGTVTDIDGNVYRTVTIGTQIWIAENLKVTHYRNGYPIPNAIDSATWVNLTTGAYCEYGNDVSNVAAYGRLYNWNAVVDGCNIAPAGWHVPSDAEWQVLVDYLGGELVAGGKMKEAGTSHWVSPNVGASNESGFSALPGGWRNGDKGSYDYLEVSAFFWSSSNDYNRYARCLYLDGVISNAYRSSLPKPWGVSVRCVKGDSKLDVPAVATVKVDAITQGTAQSGGTITWDGGAAITARGVCWVAGHTPTIADNLTIDGVGIGSFASTMTGLVPNTIYYVRAYANNSLGTGYGDQISFATLYAYPPDTVTDIDGNVYNTITIGSQVWMAQNLRVTHYRNGDPIPNETDSVTWVSLTTGAYCDYDNDISNVGTYGRLYNWHAVSDNRNIAPAGWHVPTDAEWTTLSNYLGDSVVSGGKMKEIGTTHWFTPNAGATNASGFTALPGGYRYYYYSTYHDMRYYAYFWSSTEFKSYFGWGRILNHFNSRFNRYQYFKEYGFSVRCVKD